MKHTQRYVSSIPTVPTKFTGGQNVVIFSDWPLTIVHNEGGGDNRYEKTLFLTLKNVSNFWIQREDVGTVPNGVVEILIFSDSEFSPPDRKPVELWGSYTQEFVGLSTVGASPVTQAVQLPGSTYGILQQVSLIASAAGVALTRLDVLDNVPTAVQIFSHQQLAAQTLLLQAPFPGIKVTNLHNIRFFYTPTVGSSADLRLNYKIGGG